MESTDLAYEDGGCSCGEVRPFVFHIESLDLAGCHVVNGFIHSLQIHVGFNHGSGSSMELDVDQPSSSFFQMTFNEQAI